jgi:2-dehydro-3-deoxyglucarate aldolase
MVGPYDISGSLRVPGHLDHPRVKAACARVVAACARAGKSCGTHLVEPSKETVHKAFATGYTFLVLASDIFVLWKWAERTRQLVRTARTKTAHAPSCRRSCRTA